MTPPTRHPATVGVLALVALLERKGVSIDELRERTGLSRSGAYRMLDAVRAAGVQVDVIRARGEAVRFRVPRLGSAAAPVPYLVARRGRSLRLPRRGRRR